MREQNGPPSAELFADAKEPESDDPAEWTPPEVLGLVLMYAYGVEALPQQGQPGWVEVRYLCDDILFNRDLLQDWLELNGHGTLEDLIDAEAPNLPTVEESDERLEVLYAQDETVRAFIDNEYATFRDEVDPPRRSVWWWLDAEYRGRQVH